MMRGLKMGVALAIATLGMTGTAFAQDFDLMEFADGDHDGKVTPAEFAQFSEQGWNFFAQGADSVKVASLDPMAKGSFSAITPDANGVVTREVYMAAVPARFTAADKNADGTLSAAELNAAVMPTT